MAIQLISLDDIKTYLSKEKTDEDGLLLIFIKHVSETFQTYTNRKFKKEYRSQYFDSGKKRYFVNAYPIDSTSVVTVTYASDVQTVNDDFWIWHDDGIIEFYDAPSYTEPKEIYITWLGGYDEVSSVLDVPYDLKFACILQTAFMFKSRSNLGVQSMTLPNGSISILNPTTLLPEVKRILNSYKASLLT